MLAHSQLISSTHAAHGLLCGTVQGPSALLGDPRPRAHAMLTWLPHVTTCCAFWLQKEEEKKRGEDYNKQQVSASSLSVCKLDARATDAQLRQRCLISMLSSRQCKCCICRQQTRSCCPVSRRRKRKRRRRRRVATNTERLAGSARSVSDPTSPTGAVHTGMRGSDRLRANSCWTGR